MRIGIDARLWNESGVGRYIRNLVYWLAKIDKENEYVLFLGKKEFFRLQVTRLPARQASYKLQVRKVLADIRWHTLKEQLLLPQVLKKERLDLVHFPYFSVPVFYKGPFVITVHDLTITHFPTGRASTLPYPAYFLKHLGYQLVLVRAIKKAKKIIVPSQATKKEILDHFGVSEEKIAVTYEGVDKKNKYEKLTHSTSSGLMLSKVEALNIKNTNQKLKKLKTKEYFLYVGNAYPHKNLERLLEAFLKLKTQNLKLKATTKNLKLVLVGKSDYFYERLKRTVGKMGIKDDVVFYGQADDQEFQWLYQNAIALVLPSLMEGFGLPALEAMSCGCLVLASNIPALKEVCEETAIYFNPLNSDDITEKMSGVFAHQNAVQYKSKIEAGLKRAKMFSWQKMAKETLSVYNSLIGSNNNQINSNGS